MPSITAPVTFNVFGRANRPAGTYVSASATIPEGVYAVGISDTMTAQDAFDPTNQFILTVFVSPDGVDWRGVFREIWQGGTFISKQTGLEVPKHIRLSWSNTELASGAWTGWSVRAELDQQVTMRVGFDVVAYPPGFNPSES